MAISVSHEKADFTEIKQFCENISRALGLNFDFKEKEHDSFIKGRFVEFYVGKEKIGYLGELSPQVLNNWSLDMPTSVAEIYLERLYEKIFSNKV